MGKIQTGRFERLGARTYSIKGPGALVDLDETVLGVVQLERQAGMEAHLMQEWRTFGASITYGPSPPQHSWIHFGNPVGSDHLIVIDGFSAVGIATGTSIVVFQSRGVPPAFAVGSPPSELDTRMPAGGQSVASISARHTATASFGNVILEANTTDYIDYPMVLAPDGSILFRTAVINTSNTISIRYAERVAAPFELT